MKRISIVVFSIILLFFISGCNQTAPTIDNVSFDTAQLESSYEISNFNIDDYFLTVTFSDGTTQQVAITESMISTSDLAKLSVVGDQTIEVLYQGYKVSITIKLTDTSSELTLLLLGIYNTGVSEGSIVDMTYEEWLESVKGEQGLPGEDGTDGREVLFQVSDGYIQWQYTGDDSWNNLISVTDLIGPQGDNGIDGKSAYELYVDYHPEYTGDELQWLNALINGHLSFEYEVTFDPDNGEASFIQLVQDSKKAEKPNNPEKEGFSFLGWYDQYDELWVFGGYSITENITLTAKWKVNSYQINYFSFLGTSSSSDILLYPEESIAQIELGDAYSGALTSFGRLFMWGDNMYGELGIENLHPMSTPVEVTSRFMLNDEEKIISISFGDYHSSALTSEGRVFMFGNNFCGEIGDGTTTNATVPTDITSYFNLANGEEIIQVALGYHHSSALTSYGRIFTWGFNGRGQLGDGTQESRLIPTDITMNIPLSENESIIHISMAWDFSAALTSSGRLFMWGSNGNGTLGTGTSDTYLMNPTEITNQFILSPGDKIISVEINCVSSAVLTQEGRLFMFGSNGSGQLGVDNLTISQSVPIEITDRFGLMNGETIVKVSLGLSFTSAITSNNRLFTWGYNGDGQLGDGTTINKSIPIDITDRLNLEEGDDILEVSLGFGHTSVLTSSGMIFLWGNNWKGQLGDGSYESSINPEIRPHFIQLSLIFTESYNYGETINTYVPIKDGFSFAGWFADESLLVAFDGLTMPAKQLNLYAKWVQTSN